MKLKYVMLFLSTIMISSLDPQSKDEALIRNRLQAQVAAWNSGNIDDYMRYYWNSEALMYIGKSGITYGWQKTLENYKLRYPDKAAMGKLTDQILAVKKLSSQYYRIIGKWHLTRSIGDIEGHYTLLIHKINGKWVIVEDHTS